MSRSPAPAVSLSVHSLVRCLTSSAIAAYHTAAPGWRLPTLTPAPLLTNARLTRFPYLPHPHLHPLRHARICHHAPPSHPSSSSLHSFSPHAPPPPNCTHTIHRAPTAGSLLRRTTPRPQGHCFVYHHLALVRISLSLVASPSSPTPTPPSTLVLIPVPPYPYPYPTTPRPARRRRRRQAALR